MKKYQVDFKIWGKKMSHRPSIPVPSHPSTSWRESLVPRGWRSEGLSKVHTKLGTTHVKLGTVRARLGTVRARLGTVRAKLSKVSARHMVFWISKKKVSKFFSWQNFRFFYFGMFEKMNSLRS